MAAGLMTLTSPGRNRAQANWVPYTGQPFHPQQFSPLACFALDSTAALSRNTPTSTNTTARATQPTAPSALVRMASASVAVSAPGNQDADGYDRPVTRLRWQAHSPSVIVDLAGLEGIGYGGLSVLPRVRSWTRRSGGDLPLAAPQQPVRRILEAAAPHCA